MPSSLVVTMLTHSTVVQQVELQVVGGSSITPTGATYDAASGEFVMTLAGHSLSTSDKVTIADNAFTFTCTMNNNATQKTYPRPEKTLHKDNN